LPTAATLIARRLHAAGCRHAFGIPGGEVLAMMDALQAAGIRFVLTKHENGAGFMAEGAVHATGAPGILLATIGPGIANAVNVVANAWQDRVPMIVLTGAVDAAEAATYTHQVFDHTALLAPITKASLTVADGAVDVIVDKALAIATDGQPGPVHLDLPIAVATAEQPDRAYPQRACPAPMGPAPGAALDAARALLDSAARPVVVAGVDVLNQRGEAAVADFVQRFNVPLVTTYKAKGILPEDHPLSLGGHGLSPLADTHVLPFLAEADLVICAGYDPIEMRTGWRAPWDPAKAIEFTAVPNTHYMHHCAHSFVGDVAAGLAALGDGIAPGTYWSGGQVAALRAALRRAFAPEPDGWGPAAAKAAARRALPRNAVVTVDSGAHRILLSQQWDCYGPRQMLQSTALCTMGCALPLAIGHAVARPDLPAVAFTGDAGLEMILGELATLRDLALPVIVVVFVDASLGLIELKQRRTGLGNVGVDFGLTDFPALATAMGGTGVTAGSVESVEAEIAAALGRDGFTLIAVPIGRKAYDGKI